MTTAKTPQSAPAFILPDPPKSQDEKMTASQHLSLTGGAHFLAQHLGNLDTTIVGADLYITPVPPRELTSMAGAVYPDLLVAFDADPALYRAQNGYVISEQGKPPDFVLEVASPSTGRRDTVDKRDSYAQLGIPEYWRFDETGRFHGARLAGDLLVNGRYEPVEIDRLSDGSLRGHSAILNVELRWTEGRLGWHDPSTGEHVATMVSERAARIQEHAARIQEHAARIQEHAARIAAEERADTAEARIRELEDQLHQLRGE